MYGHLQEIDVGSLLSFFSNQQKSGILLIETNYNYSVQKYFYFIFFYQGDIIFAGNKYSFTLERLKEYLTYYDLENQVKKIEDQLIDSLSIVEYEAILLLSQQKIITINQEKRLYKKIIFEVLFELISLTKGNFTWQENFNLQPLIIRFKLDTILPKIINTSQNWRKLNPYIKYTEQCPQITDYHKLKTFVAENIYETICKKIDGKTSFLQLSRYLHKDISVIGSAIYPCVQREWINIINPLNTEIINQFPLSKSKIFYLLCITKDKSWANNIERLLDIDKYNFSIVENLGEGLNYILTNPTDLIIFDSEIHDYQQYELCKIIRNNQNYKLVPIILVVNKYIFKHNLLSKINGATEYITKKIFNKNFFNLLDKYL